MTNFYHSTTPQLTQSLHSMDFEHDNCGMGAIVNIHGQRSHEVVRMAFRSVCNMTHRGAVDADGKTGDGSGLLSQLPHRLFRKELAKQGITLDHDLELGVGVFFLPAEDTELAESIRQKAEQRLQKRHMQRLIWRPVPIDKSALGQLALRTCPQIEHLLIRRPAGWSDEHFERQLYLIRRELEADARSLGWPNFYIPTLSHRLISYKALAMPAALEGFYLDLRDPDFESAIVLFHQRFSTNTFPAWPLGQPFRMLAHNGEINTIRGNRNWMASREEFFESEVWGEDVAVLRNLLSENESDSASLDHAIELLRLSGRSLEHAMCMLVPPAFRHNPDISEELKAFYRYHRSFSEPWDGPAGLVYTDGQVLAASLDRNGLRPSRFTLTHDGLLYIGSESGAVVIEESRIVRRGRLGPGQMLSVDTREGKLRFDREIKESLAKQQPYSRWIDEHRLELKTFTSAEPRLPDEDLPPDTLARLQIVHGITKEDLEMVFVPMLKGGQEAVYSMGDDTPIAALSFYPRNLASYFKQLFAQVTNPPIDPIREWAVMTLGADLGVERNLLAETPEHAKLLGLESAILFEHELEKLQQLSEFGYHATIIDATWEVSAGADGLKAALERICKEAEQAIEGEINILIISDKNTSAERAPIPSLLATGAVHHHLNRIRHRLRASLVIETGEARDTHSIATLFGYGATAVCPYLGYASVRSLAAQDPKLSKDPEISPESALNHYRRALEKGLLKIMSKMGISVLNSYQGAQIFEAVGIAKEVVDFAFTGTASRIGGVGFREIAEESLTRHRAAYPSDAPADFTPDLGDPGYNRYRKTGETHSLSTEVIKNFHTFVKSGNRDEYDDYVKAMLDEKPIALRHLFEFVPSSNGPVPLEEVEPIENIRRRFTTAAMSLGALSPEAHETLAIAMNRIGGRSDSGEGGEDPVRFTPYPNGDLARSRIKQVASGRFGVSPEYLVNADELEIKMAQGAKPGEGGQLPGHKVNHIIARLRRTQPGVQLISPPPHHDIYSIEDLAQLIHDLKEANPKARVTVKLVSEAGVGTVAAGVAKANADVILVSGHDGGTAASPLSSIKHAGVPWELGLAETQQTLVLNKLRGRVTLRTDGGLKSGRDIITAAILGAEEYNFGTIAMIAMGCVYVRKCHLNNCPVGVATTDPKFRAKFKGTPEQVVNFFNAVAEEVREIMASLGVRKLDDLIGRPEFIRQREVPNHPKANLLDLSSILKDANHELGDTAPRIATQDRNNAIHKEPLDLKIIEDAHEAIQDARPVELAYDVVNTDRNLGTRLSGRVAEFYGDNGLPNGTIQLTFTGTAGQSLGTFLAGGIAIRVIGEGNDYVGKGMAGGEIIIHPGPNANFEPEKNSIVGNTVLYGATGGKLFVNGRAGERFCVRNSGATAVVEGVGDHGCEYMTRGTALILGRTGLNFGAGMSGGQAFVLDEDGRFHSRINTEMVVDLPLRRQEDIDLVHKLLEQHLNKTQSPKAKALLDSWPQTIEKFVRVIPKRLAQLEKAEEEHEAASMR